MTMNMYRYAFVDAYSIYWFNQATGTVSEAEGNEFRNMLSMHVVTCIMTSLSVATILAIYN